MRGYALIVPVLLIILLFPPAVKATESAFGRYLPGVFAGPASEIVPPVPGLYMQWSTFYYKASASNDLQVPLGRNLHAGMSVNYFSTALTCVWVPEFTPGKNVNVALGVTLPIQALRVEAGLGSLNAVDDCAGLGDMVLTPAIGWHSGPHLLAANVSIFMPTGKYEAGDMANIGMNYWTFTPSLAYTYVNPEFHIDFSTAAGVDINTRNNDTDYLSGAMFHMDATLLYTFNNGFGAGVFGSILYQITDDRGDLADRLDGFRGRSFAIGPMIKYSGSGDHAVTINLNWAPEFGVKNRLEGDAVYLNMTMRF